MPNLRDKLWSRIIGFLIGLAMLGLPVAAAAQSNLDLQGNPPKEFRGVLPFQSGPGATPIENLPNRFQSIAQIVATIFNIVIGISGAIFMVLLLVGGVQYMTAAGNEENTTKAKKLLVDAVIGLILTLSAWAIGTFILRQFYGPTSGVFLPSGGGTRPGGGPVQTVPRPDGGATQVGSVIFTETVSQDQQAETEGRCRTQGGSPEVSFNADGTVTITCRRT